MAEHMRIALLDPKWKEKSGLTKPGEKDDTLAKGDVVGDNLKRLAQKRKDIFGTDEVRIASLYLLSGFASWLGAV